jgi:hypothetical protein
MLERRLRSSNLGFLIKWARYTRFRIKDEQITV